MIKYGKKDLMYYQRVIYILGFLHFYCMMLSAHLICFQGLFRLVPVPIELGGKK